MVRDVIVCDRGSTDQTHNVAEHAGCHFIADGGIAAGIARAKGDWLLIIEPGARLIDGWIEPVVAHVSEVDDAGPFLAGPRDRLPFLARVFSAATGRWRKAW